MSYFNAIQEAIEQTERAQNVIRNYSAATFPWADVQKRTVISVWLLYIFGLATRDIATAGNREPILFMLADKICVEDKGRLLKFINEMHDLLPTGALEPLMKNKPDQWRGIIPSVHQTVRAWGELSQDYLELSRQNLDELTYRPDTKTFYCMIREFHPRKIHSKHPWNEVQATSIETLSTEDIVKSVDEDPIEGSRFFLPGDHAPATGISIIAGHHRIYVLYRRYINGRLQNTCINEHCSGDILVRFVEKW